VDRIDHMISAIDTTAGLWQDTVKQAPVTAQTIVPNNKVHPYQYQTLSFSNQTVWRISRGVVCSEW
jgi:hypothetical protein